MAGRGLLRWGVVGGAIVLAVAFAVVLLAPGPTIDLWPVTLAFWCTVTLGSGIALVIAWRIGGWARPGRLGTGLVSLALFVSLLPRFSELVASIDSLRDIRPLGTAVILLVAVTYLVRGVRRDDVDTDVQPVYELGTAITVMTVGVLASVTVLLLSSDSVQHAVEWGPAGVSLLGAVAVAVTGRHPAPVVARAIGVALLLMSIASAFHHASTNDVPQAIAAAAMCSAAVIFAGVARALLKAALALQDARSLQTLSTLGQYSTEVTRERERRHDALNALAAIRSATDVLTTRGQDLDRATRTELSLAARDELARVERMLSPVAAVATEVSLTQVLRPVLLARTAAGLAVDSQLDDVQVRVVPDIVVRIVDNLLCNVERHAPDATVRLITQVRGDVVEVHVVDTGPGIPVQRQAVVFEPGVTTSAAGQGLGLPSARRLAQDQGGDLFLLADDSGCHFVLSLPRSGARAPVTLLRAQAG